MPASTSDDVPNVGSPEPTEYGNSVSRPELLSNQCTSLPRGAENRSNELKMPPSLPASATGWPLTRVIIAACQSAWTYGNGPSAPPNASQSEAICQVAPPSTLRAPHRFPPTSTLLAFP